MRKNVKLGKLILGLMLAIFVIGTGPGMTPVVKAADEPAAIKDTYEVDGVTYYNTKSDSFASDSSQFIKETMSGQSSELAWKVSDEYTYNRSMADLYLEAAAGLLRGKGAAWDPAYNMVAIDKAACSGSPDGTQTVGNKSIRTSRYPRSSMELKSSDMESPKAAEQYLYDAYGIKGGQSSTGYFKSADDAKPNTTYVAAIRASGDTTDIVAVYFNNFKVVALLPEDAGNNYVTTTTGDNPTYSDMSASTVKNDTAERISTTQEKSRNYSWSVNSSVSGSESYSYEESIKVSTEFKFGIFEKLGIEAGFTATQAFEKGWSKDEGYSNEDGDSLSETVELPPYTNVMLRNATTDADYTTRYNCPVALTFDVAVVAYSTDGAKWGIEYGNNARKTLGKRYNEFKGEDRTDPDGVNWSYVTQYDRTGDTHIGEAIEKATTFVPMSPAGAQFTQKMHVIAAEVAAIMPIYPLKKVKADKTSLELPNGASMNIEEINLSGLNEKNAPYYGFDAEKGSWKVINDKQEEITDNAPVEISKDSMTGQVSIKAIAPGTCWLKYEIKEDAYSTAEHPTTFTKNSELDSTAVIKVDVTADYTVKASGSFTGYVDEEPEALDAKGKLRAGVYNKEDIEIDGDIIWEKQEKDGITITDNHLVSFTEPGTYHVRPRCGDKWTDWIEITAKYREYNVTFKYQNGTADKTVAVIKGEKVSKPSASSTACSTFTGWFTDKAGKEAYDFDQPVTKDLTLYAVWKDNHKWSSKYTVDKAATYAAPGSKSIHCTVCNAVKPGSKVVIPKKKVKPTVLKKVAPKKGGFVAKWKKGTGINGYVLQYCQNKKFKKGAKKVTIKKAKVVKKAVMKLPAKKKYFVRIRTFKTFKGKKYYSTWSKPKRVKTK